MREWAARVLAGMLVTTTHGRDGRDGPAVPRHAVERLLHHGDTEIRRGALNLTGRLEPSDGERLLRAALSDSSLHVRAKAARISRGPEPPPPWSREPPVPPLAAETTAALEGLLADPESLPRIASAAALLARGLGGNRPTRTLADEIRRGRTWLRISELREAISLGPRAAGLLDALRAAAGDSNAEVWDLAGQAIEAAHGRR